jgi:hypothetical protein
MSKLKKWKCPHCPQNSARHWNMVVHIRRWHGGLGNPAEKMDPNQAERPFAWDPNRANRNKEYSPNRNFRNRPFVNCAATGRVNESLDDPIEYTYNFLTEFEDKVYKVGEIDRITSKLCSSATTRLPSIDYVNPSPLNIMGEWLMNILKNNYSTTSVKNRSDTYFTAGPIEESKNTTDSSFLSNGKYRKHETNSSNHIIHTEDDASEKHSSSNSGWVRKFDMYGNLIDTYRSYGKPEFLEEGYEYFPDPQ